MHDEHEVQRMDICNSIEYQHGLDGKVPRTGAIGSWYDNGDRTDYEGHQCTVQAQMGGEVEAEEREIVMQEVAQPA